MINWKSIVHSSSLLLSADIEDIKQPNKHFWAETTTPHTFYSMYVMVVAKKWTRKRTEEEGVCKNPGFKEVNG